MNQYKPELGRFYGDSNPEVWVFQAERYFNFYGFSKDSWLSMPYVYFKGEARAWFDWLYRNDQFWDWKHFTEKLALHYRKYTIADSMRCPTVSSQASYTNLVPMGSHVSYFADQCHSSRSYDFSSMFEVEKPKAQQMFEEMYDGIFTSAVEITSSVTAAASQSIASHETGKSEVDQVFDKKPETYSAYLENDSNRCTTELATLGNQICESGDATSLVKSEMAALEEREVVANPCLFTPKETDEVDGSMNNDISCLCRYGDAPSNCEICISRFMVGSKPAASDNTIEKATMVINPVIFPDLSVGKSITTKVLDGSFQRISEGKYISSTDASNSCYSDNALNTMSAKLINVHPLPPDHFGFDFPFDPGSHFIRSYGSSVIRTNSVVEVIKIAAESPDYFGMLKLTMGEFLDQFSVPAMCIRDTVAATIRKIFEFIGARVVSWDMRKPLVFPWFQGDVGSAPLPPQLDEFLDELCGPTYFLCVWTPGIYTDSMRIKMFEQFNCNLCRAHCLVDFAATLFSQVPKFPLADCWCQQKWGSIQFSFDLSQHLLIVKPSGFALVLGVWDPGINSNRVSLKVHTTLATSVTMTQAWDSGHERTVLVDCLSWMSSKQLLDSAVGIVSNEIPGAVHISCGKNEWLQDMLDDCKLLLLIANNDTILVSFASYHRPMKLVLSSTEGFHRRVIKTFQASKFSSEDLAMIFQLLLVSPPESDTLLYIMLHPSCSVDTIVEFLKAENNKKQNKELTQSLVDPMLINPQTIIRANEESFGFLFILQLRIDQRSAHGGESILIHAIGQLSFIDVANRHQGADNTANDKQTKLDEVVVIKWLLALLGCFRALDNDQFHTFFRASTFSKELQMPSVANSCTAMIYFLQNDQDYNAATVLIVAALAIQLSLNIFFAVKSTSFYPNLEDKVLIEGGSIVMNSLMGQGSGLENNLRWSSSIKLPNKRLTWDPGPSCN